MLFITYLISTFIIPFLRDLGTILIIYVEERIINIAIMLFNYSSMYSNTTTRK